MKAAKSYGATRQKMSTKGARGGSPHPNGAGVIEQDVNLGRMAEQFSTPAITHTPLQVPPDGTAGTSGPSSEGRMPKQIKGGRQRDPHRR